MMAMRRLALITAASAVAALASLAQAQGPVSGAMRLGQFRAASMSADLGQRTVTLSGARLKIVQGAVR